MQRRYPARPGHRLLQLGGEPACDPAMPQRPLTRRYAPTFPRWGEVAAAIGLIRSEVSTPYLANSVLRSTAGLRSWKLNGLSLKLCQTIGITGRSSARVK